MRIYTYGARPPITNANLVHQQLRLAHAYQCALVAIERRRRAAVDWLYIHACPAEAAAYDLASQASQAASEALRQSRGKYKGDMLEPDEEMSREDRDLFKIMRQTLLDARQAEKVARQAWYDARKRATPRLKHRLRMCDRGAQARGKRAYNLASTVGLAWGTRLKVAESAERAAKAAGKEGSLPHFPRFDGGGMVAVQLQGESGIAGKRGLSPSVALGGEDTRLQIQIVSRAALAERQGRSSLVSKRGRPLPQPVPGSRRSARNAVALVRLRMASDGREPVWAEWPIVLHRPLPETAAIKWAAIHASKVGDRTTWQLLLTVDEDAPAVKPLTSTLAVNLGWRNLEDGGLRVGYAVGTDGHDEELRVPDGFGVSVAHVDSIRSIRDRKFEEVKKALSQWVTDLDEPPAWLVESVRYIDMWRAPKKLAFLLRDWGRQRFDGDVAVFDSLVAWRKKDRHLRFWECDKRASLLRMRKESYRCIAAHLADKYSKVIVTAMDLRDFAELPAPEESAKGKGGEQRRSRTLAAPSELRDAIKNACSTRGVAFEEVKAVDATQTCHACKRPARFAAAAFLKNTCECGVTYDQDANHARNLLASDEAMNDAAGLLAPSVPEIVPTLVPAKGRWGKRRSKTISQSAEIIGKAS